MKQIILIGFCICSMHVFSQNLQLHYDFRHSIDPKRNSRNFPTIYFEYFKAQADTSSFIKPGSFFLKAETDLQGNYDNIGKAFIQVLQSFRFWKPKIYLTIQYSGGLGVTEPKQYSYYINNSFSVGSSYPFQWKGAYFSVALSYSHNTLKKPSNDGMFTLYWGKGFWNYKVEFSGDFELYTANKNQGDDFTKNLNGKRIIFFGEPQVWFNIRKGFALGSRALLYYHIITTENLFEVYPTVAVRIKF